MPDFPDWLTSAQSIAIVGNGREGKSTTQFLRKYFPHTKVFIFENHQDHFDVPSVDVVFKSPGIPKKFLTLSSKSYLTSQADLFTQLFGEQTIAVTGTKGKSTTAHAIAHVLNALGHHAVLIGNIGRPALDFVDQMDDETTAVFEMSAFQTESLHRGTHIAVFTSLYQDHLDYYDTMEEYTRAKQHLFLLQTETDLCLYRDEYPNLVALLSEVRSKRIPYNAKLLDVPTNYIPAVLIARERKASEKQIKEALSTLKTLPGRMEKVAEQRGISFYDDAVATIPEATILAIDSTPHLATLIVGGFDRHQSYDALATKIATSTVHTLIHFPTTGAIIADLVSALAPSIKCVPVQSMEEAITQAYALTPSGSSVLMSTASPSFGLFEDYADRSRQYKKWIESVNAP